MRRREIAALRRGTTIVALIVAVSVGLIIAWQMTQSHNTKVAKADQIATGVNIDTQSVEVTDKQAEAFKVEPVTVHRFRILKDSVGSIGFNENMLVQCFTPNPGRIVEIRYNVGDEVNKGDTLFTVDSPDLLQAESALLASAGVFELQSRVLTRVKQLLKTGGGAQKDVDQATSDQQTAEGNYKSARNAVRIFGKTDAEIDQIVNARKVDSILVVPSPIAGRIIARNAAPGLFVQPGNAPAPFTLADVSTMWMVANVIETDAPAFKVGQPVEVRVPAYPDTIFRGRVTTVGSNIDPNSHRQLVRSVIEDPMHQLRSGMLASFTIEIADPVQSPAVPLEAVVREGDGTMTVWAATDRHRFTRRTVKVGLDQDGFRQILGGLQPDELVATSGAIFLSNKFAVGPTG